MKLAICQNCRRKLLSLIYEPKYCRNCGRRNLKVYSFGEWLILAAVAVLTVKFLWR